MKKFTFIVSFFALALNGFAGNDTKISTSISGSITEQVSSTLTAIISYEIYGQVTSTIGDSSVDVVVPAGTDLATLVPSFSLSDGATAAINSIQQVSGTTVVDFTSGSVTYKVTAEDGITTQDWVVNVSVENGVNDAIAFNVNVYPNPASDYVIIENAENTSITVYNIIGRMLSSVNSMQSNYTLNLNNYSRGTYFVRVQKGKQLVTKKITIVK
jgi:hypothetical protein